MRLPQTLRTGILRQRWLVAAEQFQLHLALANPVTTSSERRTLALRLKARCDLLIGVCAELRHLKANFNPAQARIPAGQPGAGQWTSGEGGSISERPADSLAQDDLSFIAGSDPQEPSDALGGADDNPPSSIIGFAPDGTPILAAAAGPPSNTPEEPPEIPEQRPPTPQGATRVAKALARWMAGAIDAIGERAESAISMLEFIARTTSWLQRDLPSIGTYQDPPKTLDELYAAVDQPRAGTDIHHIMEQSALRKLDIPDDIIDGPDNLVRIPRYKHQDITAWYAKINPDYENLSPRDYLSDKSMTRHREVGLFALRLFGVLKP